MPNLAVEYGQGVLAFAENSNIPSELRAHLNSIFSVMGLILWIPEDKMNAISS